MSPTTPHPFLLPTTAPNESLTILTLPHPRTLTPTRYLLHSTKGLHELTKISAPTAAPRSWLLTPSSSKQEKEKEKEKTWLESGYILQDDAFYVSTPMDPLFLILQKLTPAAAAATGKASLFLPMEDLLDTFFGEEEDEELHWGEVLKAGSTIRRQIEARVRAVCDTVDVGGDPAFRISKEKLVSTLARKCENMAKELPRSLEAEFVTKALSKPVTTEITAPEEEEEEGEKKDGEDSEMTDAPAATKEANPDSPEDVKRLLRLRTSSNFLAATCLPSHVSTLLATHLSSIHDFSLLDGYLAELKRLRAEANSVRAGDFALKRKIDEEEGADARAEKKKKAEEEKKKEKTKSRGVKTLEKVNTRGMAKMTSFFKKV
ncbi:hypothetical protein RUND412_001930 [Rhizina undulata]